jgi:hypothetical protein
MQCALFPCNEQGKPSSAFAAEEIAMLVPRPVPAGRLACVFGCFLCACATREVPRHYPKTAAAWPEAATPASRDVTTALAQEPESEPAAAGEAAPASSPHEQQGAHHHAH